MCDRYALETQHEDGRLIKDTVTGFEWRVGSDSDTDWMTANLWVESGGNRAFAVRTGG